MHPLRGTIDLALLLTMFKIHRCELLRAFLNLRERIQKFYLVDALIFYSINLNEGSVLSLRMAEETKKD